MLDAIVNGNANKYTIDAKDVKFQVMGQCIEDTCMCGTVEPLSNPDTIGAD